VRPEAAPAAVPALAPGEVHVWIAPLPSPLPWAGSEGGLADSALSADERERALRFSFPAPRERFVGVRHLLRRLLAGYCGSDPGALCFRQGAHGKPTLEGSPVRFNVSHTDGLALIAVADGVDVGVDVERIRAVTRADGLANRYFTAGERAALDGTAGDFLRLWTCKEAAVKATGLGISAGWSDVEIHRSEGNEAHATGLGQACHLTLLDPAPGYVGAVAALAGGAMRLRTLHAADHLAPPHRTRTRTPTPLAAGAGA